MPPKISVAADLERELLTAQDFIEWLKPGRHADLIDGEVFMHSPVSIRHADLLNFVDGLLRMYVDRHELGRLYREVVAVRLSSRNVFLPDLAFYAAERGDVYQESYADGAPDLVVEALSPRTADRDVGPKFAEYEQHGVREYWVLDPETLAHRFYRRDTEGILTEFSYGQERIESRIIPGFFVLRPWLDPAVLPKLDECLAAIEAGG
jgi:Uma2 family endonuclease